MERLVRNIPNCITAINLGSGCMAIIAASHGGSPLWGLLGFQWAFLFMAIGGLADFLDGLAARTLNAYAELGKELDSLCDVVTFGVAPAMTLYFLMNDMIVAPWLCWTVLLIPLSAALRLARFNIDTRQATTFIGMPVPANAIFWIGYAALMWDGVQVLGMWYVFLPFLLVECWLMNSNIPMFSLKVKSLRLKDSLPIYILGIAAAVFCFTLGVGGLFWLIVFYVLCGFSFKQKNK